MKFGKDMEMSKAETNYQRAIVMLRDKKPIIGTDTKINEDGRHFIFNMEVSADEYNKFLDQYNEIMEREISLHEETVEGKEDLGMAA